MQPGDGGGVGDDGDGVSVMSPSASAIAAPDDADAAAAPDTRCGNRWRPLLLERCTFCGTDNDSCLTSFWSDDFWEAEDAAAAAAAIQLRGTHVTGHEVRYRGENCFRNESRYDIRDVNYRRVREVTHHRT